jgi:transketolase
MTAELDRRSVDTIRALAMDAVEQAQSGHPGAPMGLAPLGYALFTTWLEHDPDDPAWPDRDRFVLSSGHASMLLYSLLHLSGYDVSVESMQRFRQLGSAAPGHPEHGHTPGVETTTGPLGQGLGNAVGMALAEQLLAARFNRPGHEIIDHRTVVIASDGDLMEGVAAEAASLAGHLGLGKLIVCWDDNATTIDGPTDLAFADEDVLARFAAYGWRTVDAKDGLDLTTINVALGEAFASDGRPMLVRVPTTIGYPAPSKGGTSAAHGAPLGSEEVAATKQLMGWTEVPFSVPADVAAHTRPAGARTCGEQRVAGAFRSLPAGPPAGRIGARAAVGRSPTRVDCLRTTQLRGGDRNGDARHLRAGPERRREPSSRTHRRFGGPGFVEPDADRRRR